MVQFEVFWKKLEFAVKLIKGMSENCVTFMRKKIRSQIFLNFYNWKRVKKYFVTSMISIL